MSVAECFTCLAKGRELTPNAAGRLQCDHCRADERREIEADERFEREHEDAT